MYRRISHVSRFRLLITSAALLVTLLTNLGAVGASPLSDGNAAYKAHDYVSAVADFQQAASSLSGPEQAKAYYKLGLAYRKQDDRFDALAAFQKAQTIDPTLSFASSAQKFQDMESSVQTGSSSPPEGSAGSSDPAAKALTTADVFVDPATSALVNTTTLAQVAENDDHTIAKIAVYDHLPTPEYVSRYAHDLHDYLDLGRNALIVVALHSTNGYPGGVGLSASTLTTAEEDALTQKYVAQIGSGSITAGVSGLAAAATTEIDAKEQRVPNMVMTAVLVALVIFGILIIAANRKKKIQMNALRVALLRA